MTIPEVRTQDIQFYFTRENPFDEEVRIRAIYSGPANIYRDNILLKTDRIADSYSSTDYAKCRCFLAVTLPIAIIVGPVLIMLGAINLNNTITDTLVAVLHNLLRVFV